MAVFKARGLIFYELGLGEFYEKRTVAAWNLGIFLEFDWKVENQKDVSEWPLTDKWDECQSSE